MFNSVEWIQNSDFQNSDITKQRLLQNSDNYKTATTTKQRLLQNSDCYKTAKNNIIEIGTNKKKSTFKKSLKKIVEKNLPIFKEKNQRFYKED